MYVSRGILATRPGFEYETRGDTYMVAWPSTLGHPTLLNFSDLMGQGMSAPKTKTKMKVIKKKETRKHEIRKESKERRILIVFLKLITYFSLLYFYCSLRICFSAVILCIGTGQDVLHVLSS